jgi:hypothetical protein
MDSNAFLDARSYAIELLCQAQARGDLSVEAFEARFVLIQEATNAASIEAIVADLMPRTPAAPVRALARDEQYEFEPYAGYTPTDLPAVSDEPLRLTAVFRSTQRAGPWTVQPSVKCLVIMGSLTLDFREAEFLSDEVDLEISTYVGEVKILVPLDVEIEHEIRGVVSTVKHNRSRAKRHVVPAIHIRIHGDAFMADIKIKEKAADPIDRIPFEGVGQKVKGWLGQGRGRGKKE